MKKKLYLLAILPFTCLILFYEILPLIITIGKSFLAENEKFSFTLEHYKVIFQKPLYQSAIRNSLIISSVSSIVGLVVSFVAAKIIYQKNEKERSFCVSLLNMISNFSGLPLAFSFIILIGNTGIVTMVAKNLGIGWLSELPLYTVFGILLIYIYFQIPLAILLLIPVFDGVKKEWKEAIYMLGGTERVFWKKIGIPILMPSLLGTFSTLFANALSAYASAYALLMNNYSILPIRIAEQFKGDIVKRVEFGSALAVILMLFMVISMGVTQSLSKRIRR